MPSKTTIHPGAQAGLIEPEALHTLLKSESPPKIVDASTVMPDIAENSYEIFKKERIGDAVFFDIDEICAKDNPLPHMVPTERDFATAVSAMGISNDDLIVVYDQSGLAFAAARVWWMFRLFGHDNVCVLNGGLPYWKACGFPVNKTPAPHPTAQTEMFKAHMCPHLLKSKDDILALVTKDQGFRILDARSADRFCGLVAEPRPGLRSGHIPGSRNLPYINLLNPVNGCLLPVEMLTPILNTASNDGLIVTSCGSGVTSCVLNLAFFQCGHSDVAVYDGSWTEWGDESAGTPVISSYT